MDSRRALAEEVAEVVPLELAALLIFVDPVGLVHNIDREDVLIVIVALAKFLDVLLSEIVNILLAGEQSAPLFAAAVLALAVVE